MYRMLSLVLLVFCLAVTTISDVRSQVVSAKGTQPLKDAVKALNDKAVNDSVGATQPKLTEAEVVASIFGWIHETDPAATADQYNTFKNIAETGLLPSGAEFTTINSWGVYNNRVFKVWWVDLRVPGIRKALRIRNQMISSVPAPSKPIPNDAEPKLRD